jgi:proteasome lid subunit RPN8/RPN11
MHMTAAQRDELVAHANEEAPFECCGYVTLRDGAVEEVVRGTNIRHSKTAFELDYESTKRVAFIEDEGLSAATYHSHPRSPAEPSQQDINVANYPGALYLIVTLVGRDGGPEIRAWRIEDRRVEEEDVVVE